MSNSKIGTKILREPGTIRRDFPLLASRPDLVYLDNAATTQKPQEVLDAVIGYYRESNANVHRAVYALAEEATAAYENARSLVAAFLGAPSPQEIVFTRGTTEALNLLAASLGETFLREGDEILLSGMEHHSNLVPWQLAAQKNGFKLRFLPVDKEGELDLSALDAFWTRRTKLVSLVYASNVLGTVNPLSGIAAYARERKALVAVDAAQAAGHLPLDVKELGCDFLAFSGHKMYGPLGIGVLWGREDLLERMAPYQGGGEMISSVTPQRSTWNSIPYKFEAGTPNVEGAVGLAAAVRYLESMGLPSIEAAERELTAYALKRLGEVRGLTLYGRGKRRVPVFSFNMEGIHSHDVAQFLDREGIAVRSGHHCAQPLIKSLGAAGTARASLAVYNRREDIDRLVDALEKMREFFLP